MWWGAPGRRPALPPPAGSSRAGRRLFSGRRPRYNRGRVGGLKAADSAALSIAKLLPSAATRPYGVHRRRPCWRQGGGRTRITSAGVPIIRRTAVLDDHALARVMASTGRASHTGWWCKGCDAASGFQIARLGIRLDKWFVEQNTANSRDGVPSPLAGAGPRDSWRGVRCSSAPSSGWPLFARFDVVCSGTDLQAVNHVLVNLMCGYSA